jgi:heme/copper-type cytochrome/quinol oxidase subunit 4
MRQGASFQRGPWHLGSWSYVVGTIAVIWVVFITILFMLPTASPIHWSNFNYTIVAVLVVIGFAGIYWLVSARNWFTGPRVQGTPEELAEIERELSA